MIGGFVAIASFVFFATFAAAGFVAAINWRSQCPDAAEFVISAMVGTASLAMTIWGAIIIATRFSA